MFFGGGDDLIYGLLDTDVHDVVAVIGEDDVDEVLANVVDITANRGEHDCALASLIGFLHVRLQKRNRSFHYLCRLQHEWQLHLALTESLSDNLHALEQVVVDDVKRPDSILSGLIQIGLKPLCLTIDDALS